jgi:hypothetical protein
MGNGADREDVSFIKVKLRAESKRGGVHRGSEGREVLMGGKEQVSIIGIHDDLGGGEAKTRYAIDSGAEAHAHGLYAKSVQETRERIALADTSSEREMATVTAINADPSAAVSSDVFNGV